MNGTVRGSQRSFMILSVVVFTALGSLFGCTSTQPISRVSLGASHHRDWLPSVAVLPWAETENNTVTVRNIRDFRYMDAGTYVPHYYDRTFDVDDLETIDFIVVPFKQAPDLAHTMLSFGFTDQQYLAVSVEARLEKDETYSPAKGIVNQYELMYVVADERDVIPLRTKHREDDVYVYRVRTDPQLTRQMFRDVMLRVNDLYRHPEYYNTLTNNCTTNIREHVNRLRPGRIPFDWRVLLPGHSDRLAYDLGFLDSSLTFEQTKQQANVTEIANAHLNAADFSAIIRR